MLLATSTVGPCYLQDLPPTACQSIPPETKQVQIIVNVRDRETNEPISGVLVIFETSYDQARIEADGKCRLSATNGERQDHVTDASGVVIASTNAFTMTSVRDRIFIRIQVIHDLYAYQSLVEVVDYLSPASLSMTVNLLDKSEL